MTTTGQHWLLAIDSSSESASVALSDGTAVAEVTWHAGRDQTATLLSEVDRLCKLMRTHPTSLVAVAVAVGPGMFNGLRVGMSIAKGFVLSLDLPLIGVSTLDVAAAPYVGLGMPVVATVAAGRGRLVWATYDGGAALQQMAPPRNGSVDDLVEELGARPTCLVTGELTGEQEERLRRQAGIHVPIASARIRRATVLAGFGWERYQARQFDDAVELEPIYLHSTASTTTGAATR